MVRSYVALLALLAAASCAIFESDDVCAGTGSWSFAVAVIDSLTGMPAAEGATLLTYDVDLGGSRIDSVVGRFDTDILLGADRTGLYTVVVRKQGYRDWVKYSVRVVGECTTQTVELTAKMARP